MSVKTPVTLSASARVLLSILLPLAGALLFSFIVSGSANFGGKDPSQIALQLGGAGIVSWFLGWRWYGLKGLGLRSGRPFLASIGFSFLVWVAFFIARLATVEPGPGADDPARLSFIYLLLFEAFCVQLWSYGLFFRSVADWLGPLTAAIASGVFFGAITILTLQEAYIIMPSSAFYFIVWGIVYGIIRLRTGSFLGTVVVQAMQSWSAWQLFPAGQVDPRQLRNLYLVTSALYAIIIWRLWPKEEDDYRV